MVDRRSTPIHAWRHRGAFVQAEPCPHATQAHGSITCSERILRIPSSLLPHRAMRSQARHTDAIQYQESRRETELGAEPVTLLVGDQASLGRACICFTQILSPLFERPSRRRNASLSLARGSHVH